MVSFKMNDSQCMRQRYITFNKLTNSKAKSTSYSLEFVMIMTQHKKNWKLISKMFRHAFIYFVVIKLNVVLFLVPETVFEKPVACNPTGMLAA